VAGNPSKPIGRKRNTEIYKCLAITLGSGKIPDGDRVCSKHYLQTREAMRKLDQKWLQEGDGAFSDHEDAARAHERSTSVAAFEGMQGSVAPKLHAKWKDDGDEDSEVASSVKVSAPRGRPRGSGGPERVRPNHARRTHVFLHEKIAKEQASTKEAAAKKSDAAEAVAFGEARGGLETEVEGGGRKEELVQSPIENGGGKIGVVDKEENFCDVNVSAVVDEDIALNTEGLFHADELHDVYGKNTATVVMQINALVNYYKTAVRPRQNPCLNYKHTSKPNSNAIL